MSELYDIEVTTLDGQTKDLRDVEGKVALFVNVASKCGFTPQYAGLEQLYEKYSDQGFVILGFPCNQFGAQEPGSESEIASFCEKNYGVSFPMHSKIEVNGPGTHPVYRYLKGEKKGLMGTEGIKWNFTKFLVDRNGQVVKRYAPTTKPESIASDVEKLL